MKKFLLVLGTIVLLAIIVLASVFIALSIDRNNRVTVIDTDNSQQDDDNDPLPTENASCDIDSANVSADESAFEYEFIFPGFTCTDNGIENDLNNYVESTLEEMINNIEESTEDAALRSVGFGDYDVIRNDDQFISIRMNYSVNLMGGTGDSGIFPINYNLETQEFVELGDLFTDSSDYLQKISNYSINVLKELYSEDGSMDDQIEEGAAAVASNYTTFVFDEDTLTVVFGKYQVGPGALGNPEVVIPFSEID